MKEASHKKDHIVYGSLYGMSREADSWRQDVDQGLSRTGAREKGTRVVGSKKCLPISWILLFGVMKVF